MSPGRLGISNGSIDSGSIKTFGMGYNLGPTWSAVGNCATRHIRWLSIDESV